jgi:hypothetical protein
MSTRIPALFVYEEGRHNRNQHSYYHVYAEARIIEVQAGSADCQMGRVVGPSCYDDAERHLDDFRITSQGNAADSPRHLYAWQYEYRDLLYVRADRAALMHKTFKRVDSHLERCDAKLGRADHFAEFVRRVAESLKIRYFLFAGHAQLSGYAHRVASDGEAINTIRNLVDAWVRDGEQVEQVA